MSGGTHDKLQLIDPDLARHIASLDSAGLWQVALDRLDDLNKPEHPEFSSVYAYRSGGLGHYEKLFYRFMDEQGVSGVAQSLIHDLAFLGSPVRLDAWAASGYLDHGSSARVETSRSVMPEVDEESESNAYRRDFDLLEAHHLDLIADSIRRHEKMTINVPSASAGTDAAARINTRLIVQTMAKTLRSNPTLRAAYIYQRQYRF